MTKNRAATNQRYLVGRALASTAMDWVLIVFLRPRGRDDDDAIHVGDDKIARDHPHTTQIDRLAHRIDLHPVLAGAHESACRIQCISRLVCLRRVAAYAIDDSAGNAAMRSNPAHDPTPHGAVQAAGVIEHGDGAFWHVIEVIADGAGFCGIDRREANGKGPAEDALRPGDGLNAERAARQAKVIECIGFTRSVTFSILPRVIRKFRAAFPDVQLDLVESLSEYQPAQLRQSRIDVGLSRFIGEVVVLDDLTYAVMIDDPLVAALPIRHPLTKRKSLSAVELGAVPFILYPKDPISPFGQQILALLKAAGAEPVVAYGAVEIYTALALVGAGLGGTLVGRSIAENNRSDVAFIPVRDIKASTTVVAVTRSDEQSKLVASFLEILVKSGAE